MNINYFRKLENNNPILEKNKIEGKIIIKKYKICSVEINSPKLEPELDRRTEIKNVIIN